LIPGKSPEILSKEMHPCETRRPSAPGGKKKEETSNHDYLFPEGTDRTKKKRLLTREEGKL